MAGSNEPINTAAEVDTDWLVDIIVTPKPGVNDPEGEAILHGLHGLEHRSVNRVRAGRFFQIALVADSEVDAVSAAEMMCRELLANPVIQVFEISRAVRVEQSGGGPGVTT